MIFFPILNFVPKFDCDCSVTKCEKVNAHLQGSFLNIFKMSYLDKEWCYTPETPELDPGRSDLRTAVLDCCRSSFGSEFLGCSLCYTETRNSRMTSHHSQCGQRFFPDEELHLRCTEMYTRLIMWYCNFLDKISNIECHTIKNNIWKICSFIF